MSATRKATAKSTREARTVEDDLDPTTLTDEQLEAARLHCIEKKIFGGLHLLVVLEQCARLLRAKDAGDTV